MKTIFISSFHPMIFRNILSTEALRGLLTKSDIKIIVFVLEYKKNYFKKLLQYPNIIIEGISFKPPSSKFSSLLMKRIAKFGLNSDSIRIERYRKWQLEGKFFYFLMTSIFSFFLTQFSILRKLMRYLDYQLAPPGRYRDYFEKYEPDLVIATDIQNERDVELCQNARHFKVSVWGLVRNWDNLTLHGFIRCLPDKLLVPAEIIKKQALQYNDLSPENVEVVGFSHYDKYFNGPKLTKRKFLESLGLDRSKRIILYAPIGDVYLANNDVDPHLVELLSSLDAHVIVRLSPTVPVRALDRTKFSSNVIFDRPGINFGQREMGSQEISLKDDDNLMHELYYSNIIICGPSTVGLDAIYINKPVILVDFYPTSRGYLNGIGWRYDYEHSRFLVENGAVKIARSKEDLFRFINNYFKNPEMDSEGRIKVQEAYCGPIDGKSGKRIANLILKALELV